MNYTGLPPGKFTPRHKGLEYRIQTAFNPALASEFDTVWMPEYGWEYWKAHKTDGHQLVEIAEGHLLRGEQLLLKANRYLFIVINAFTTLRFSQYCHGTADPDLPPSLTNTPAAMTCFFSAIPISPAMTPGTAPGGDEQTGVSAPDRR